MFRGRFRFGRGRALLRWADGPIARRATLLSVGRRGATISVAFEAGIEAWLPGHCYCSWRRRCGCRCALLALPCLIDLAGSNACRVPLLHCLLLLLPLLQLLLMLRGLVAVTLNVLTFPPVERCCTRRAALRTLQRSLGRGTGVRE